MGFNSFRASFRSSSARRRQSAQTHDDRSAKEMLRLGLSFAPGLVSQFDDDPRMVAGLLPAARTAITSAETSRALALSLSRM